MGIDLDDIYVDVIGRLDEALVGASQLKTGERSEQQRKLAILCTEIEKCVAWAKHTASE